MAFSECSLILFFISAEFSSTKTPVFLISFGNSGVESFTNRLDLLQNIRPM
jgi:hypothetical protein